jgi:hypothetical protein
MIHQPGETGPVRILGPVDVTELIESLRPFMDKALGNTKQQGLRVAGDFHGLADLRYESNTRRLGQADFTDWVPGTEYLQLVAKSFNIPETGRVRMLMMFPKSTYSFHHDPDAWRVHIPLITNSDSFMIVHGKMWHMPVGHAYLMQVQHHHLALNAGDENRIHVVFDNCRTLA